LLFVIVSGQAVFLNLLLNRHLVLYKNSFLPALVFSLFISASPALMLFHPVFLINLLVLYILDGMFSLVKNENVIARLFNCGFIAGISALLYFPAIIILPFLFAILSALRQFRLKEWLVIFISFCIPFFIFSTLLFWNHALLEFWNSYYIRFSQISLSASIEKKLPETVLLVFIIILVLVSLFNLSINFRKNVIRTRNFQRVFILYFFFSFAWLLVSGRIQRVHLAFLAVPLAVICANFFLQARRKIWIYELSLWVLIGLITWNSLV
jgi:hypothetical protein